MPLHALEGFVLAFPCLSKSSVCAVVPPLFKQGILPKRWKRRTRENFDPGGKRPFLGFPLSGLAGGTSTPLFPLCPSKKKTLFSTFDRAKAEKVYISRTEREEKKSLSSFSYFSCSFSKRTTMVVESQTNNN